MTLNPWRIVHEDAAVTVLARLGMDFDIHINQAGGVSRGSVVEKIRPMTAEELVSVLIYATAEAANDAILAHEKEARARKKRRQWRDYVSRPGVRESLAARQRVRDHARAKEHRQSKESGA